MKRIVIANTKGGCGKTTLATNLASFCAARGAKTVLFDYDPQGSSTQWLHARPENASPIHGVAAFDTSSATTRAWQLRVPDQTEYVIVDTAAGLRGQELIQQTRNAHCILVPLTPSSIDIKSTADFLRDLLLVAKVRHQQTRMGIVANRVRQNTRSLRTLECFLSHLNIPVLAYLRDSQCYVRASENGTGVHELNTATHSADVKAWVSIYNWLNNYNVYCKTKLESEMMERLKRTTNSA